MAWSEKLKLNKQLVRSLADAGHSSPKEIQQKTLSRIFGGQDIIAIGPEGCGKTDTYIIAVSNRLKYQSEGVPHTLILVPTKEHVLDVIGRFAQFNKNKPYQIVGLYPALGTETQMNELADGADIVVATPDRARAIYLKLGLNLNKTEVFIVDDADLIIKQGMQLPVVELANSIGKSQKMVFTEVMHSKLEKMIAPFMESAAIVEVEEISEIEMTTLPQVLYNVPNFGTKLNLLNLFMLDDELFTKTVVFANTRQTAEKIYKSLQNRLKQKVCILNSWSIELQGMQFVDDFKESTEARVLIVAGKNNEAIDLNYIPFAINFDLPPEKETFINRIITDTSAGDEEETLAITFATDIELSMVKKIEQAIGQKIPVGELPGDLVIEKEKKQAEVEEKQVHKKTLVPVAGEAFHQKKPENSKTYNFSSGQKAKMNNKKKH